MRRHYFDSAIYCRAIDPVLSLDAFARVDSEDGDSEPFDVLDPSDDPCEQLQAVELTTAAEQFVGTLTAREAHLVQRLYWDDVTQADVAREWGVSRMAVSKAVKKIHAAGRAQLAAFAKTLN